MRRRLIAALWVSLLAQGLYAAGSLSSRRAPGFSLPDRNGKQHDPQDFRGKIVLLDFMKTGCPNCVALSGVLEQIRAKYGDKVQVMSVVVPPDRIDSVNAYIQQNNITTPILFDCGQVTATFLKVTPQNPTVRFPHLFVIDKEGMIRNDFSHDDADKGVITAKTLSAEIDRLLAGAAPNKR